MSEKKILKKMGIPDFRHMTKDKIVQLATMLPYMDPEVAKKALEQFPAFKELAVGILQEYNSTIDRILTGNSTSQDAFYMASTSIISSLQKELEKEELTVEEKKHIEDKMLKIAGMISEKDSENKGFLLKIIAATGFFALGIMGTAAAVLGSNTQTSSPNLDYGDCGGLEC